MGRYKSKRRTTARPRTTARQSAVDSQANLTKDKLEVWMSNTSDRTQVKNFCHLQMKECIDRLKNDTQKRSSSSIKKSCKKQKELCIKTMMKKLEKHSKKASLKKKKKSRKKKKSYREMVGKSFRCKVVGYHKNGIQVELPNKKVKNIRMGILSPYEKFYPLGTIVPVIKYPSHVTPRSIAGKYSVAGWYKPKKIKK
tara:strand:+ start:278 stop:868 length:591 start_codon:yes stop_codon:yes gene_type:complete